MFMNFCRQGYRGLSIIKIVSFISKQSSSSDAAIPSPQADCNLALVHLLLIPFEYAVVLSFPCSGPASKSISHGRVQVNGIPWLFFRIRSSCPKY